MQTYLVYIANAVAICLLTFAVYWPRHRRKDLVVAYLGVNVGVLAVASALMTSTVGAGVGLGLFGVLSIIRLRSNELDQHEVAYYFSALALGLIGGLSSADDSTAIALMAAIVVVMFIGDHPRLMQRFRHQIVVVDRAIADEDELRAELEGLLQARVHTLSVQKLDLVDDTTLVDVRFERRPIVARPPATRREPQQKPADFDEFGRRVPSSKHAVVN